MDDQGRPVSPAAEDDKATDQQTVIRLALASSELFTTSFSVEAMVAWTRTLAKTVRETQGQLILRYLASWEGISVTAMDEAFRNWPKRWCRRCEEAV